MGMGVEGGGVPREARSRRPRRGGPVPGPEGGQDQDSSRNGLRGREQDSLRMIRAESPGARQPSYARYRPVGACFSGFSRTRAASLYAPSGNGNGPDAGNRLTAPGGAGYDGGVPA